MVFSLSLMEVCLPRGRAYCHQQIRGSDKDLRLYFRRGLLSVSGGMIIFAVGKPTEDPQKVYFVTNFVTHLVTKWVFFLYIS